MNYIFNKKINGLIHGGDYNPEQWLDEPDILKKDIEYMKEAGINEATLGVFSWAMYEPKEGEFHFEWLKQIMDNLYENGIYTILATPTGARPVWMDTKYPEVMRVDNMGNRNRHGFRHNHCLSSEVFREKARIIDRKLVETVGNHPGLLMWHISNEFGGECYCDLCKKKFQQYLYKRYDGDIDKLNHEWWSTFWSARYSSFDEIEPPYRNGQFAVLGLNLDWKRFTTQNFCDYISVEIDTIRRYSDRELPVTTNFMKRFWDIDYRELSKKIDVISWDSYPAFHNDKETFADTMLENAFDHALLRGLKPDKPFMLMESTPSQVNWMEFNKLKRPGVNKLCAAQAVACGSDTVQYFQWRKSRGALEQFHGAVIDHLGTNDTRVFKEVAETGRFLSKIGEVEGSVTNNKVAVIFEWENWWAIEAAFAFAGQTKKYDETCISYWKTLMALGIDADVISVNDVSDKYKLVIAPMLYQLTEKAASLLTEYVEQGGILLGTYMMGYVNENCLCYQGGFPGSGLNKLFGVISEEIDPLYPSDRNGISLTLDSDANVNMTTSLTVKDYAEILRVNDAEVLGIYTEDFYKDSPAFTVKKAGKGKAYYQAARCDEASLTELLEFILKSEEITHEKLAAGIEKHTRCSDDYAYTFYLNNSDKECELSNIEGENLVTGEQFTGCVKLMPRESIVLKSKLL
ncbi:MAG: beta-galactosidase [Clostridia bacterium]|nr:beta-galactosidase [Clostridia bacterium]